MSDTISLAPKQRWSARRATKRLNVWEGSVRSGKTYGTIFKWCHHVGAQAPAGDLLMVGKTIDSLKRNVINPLIDLVGTNHCTYFPGRRELRLFGRTISTVGASDERSEQKIRGMTCAGALGDELTLWPESFFQMLLSRLSVEGAQFFGTTNPDNPNHWLMKNYLSRAKSLDMARFQFSIDDNPFLPQSYVEALKKEYTGLWYKRFILGQWCAAEGSIYDFFDPALHTAKQFPEPLFYTAAYDYGTTNPTAFGLYGHNPLTKPRVWKLKEYYYDPAKRSRQQTDTEFSADFRAFIAPFRSKIRHITGDPSAESFTLQLRRDGVHGIRDANNEVLDGIRTVSKMLKSGEYVISADACPETINEIYGYVWDPKKQALGEDAPLKKNDHTCDCDRYEIHTSYGTSQYSIHKFVD